MTAPASPPKPGNRAARRGRLLLPAVLICLTASIALRLAAGTGAALAEEVKHLMPAADDGPGAEIAGAANPARCPSDADLSLILERLSAREAAVAAAEKTMAERRQALTAAEVLIGSRLAELKEAEASLQATMTRASTAAEDDLARLTAVYEAMKPKDAVPLFEAMAPDFAAGFLGRMRPEAAGPILSGMGAERAYAVSVLLAGRNAEVPVPPKAPGK